MALAIRPAGPRDAALAIAIDPVAASSGERAQWLRAAFAGAHGRIARLAVLDGRPAGFAVVGAFLGNPFLELIVTDPGLRRRGVAAALFDAIEAEHADRKLFVSTNVSNAAMRALLSVRGYLPAGQIDHLDPGDPELFFVRLPA